MATKKGGTKKGAGTKAKAALPPGLTAAIAAAIAAGDALDKQLAKAGLVVLTPNQRLHSNGRLHVGEEKAMAAILATVDAYPEAFQFMAAKDHGVDDLKVETLPAYNALARRDLVLPLQTRLEKVLQRISDDVLASSGLAKDVTSQAYKIMKANVEVKPELRADAQLAFDFYEGPAQKAQATREKNLAAKK